MRDRRHVESLDEPRLRIGKCDSISSFLDSMFTPANGVVFSGCRGAGSTVVGCVKDGTEGEFLDSDERRCSSNEFT